MLISHLDPSSVKHFESKLDDRNGYWSPSTSSIDWCERNYVVNEYIAEFWNTLSSLIMCLLAGTLFIQGLYYKIERRFLVLCLSFGLVGLGSAYFHGTLTHVGQMFDELPMVYTMIVWLIILFRMNKFEKKKKRFSIDILILCGIFYALLCSYIHSLESYVIIFQIHFTLMVLGGIIKLIYLYRESEHHTNQIMYLIILYIGLLFPAIICWIIDQQLCEQMNSINGFNPQFHAWWHLLCAIDAHIGIVCAQSIRILSIKYHQHKNEIFKPEDHLHIVIHLGLPFVDYEKEKKIFNNKQRD